jgi:hypothetical protein
LVGLLALNGALVVALGVVALAPFAQAQNRPRGTFTMVAGQVRGQTPPSVYIIDETTQELVAVTWDDQTRTLTGMGYRNLAADAVEAGRTRN